MQLKEQAKELEGEAAQLRNQIAHLHHAARAQEVVVERLKSAIRDRVTKEERLAKRDAEAYARLKRAFIANKGGLSTPYVIMPPVCNTACVFG